eukprot:TRINITY_DN88028_c0_g1_i1.p1 TRINITY_DN88028_c0_g1~~TRINITY_DN88028_c0_g1_i1.p1  ORF type:complete len:140 (-),score=6.17 TRINITY_DN88028_c0_g1_i1:267-686(-)
MLGVSSSGPALDCPSRKENMPFQSVSPPTNGTTTRRPNKVKEVQEHLQAAQDCDGDVDVETIFVEVDQHWEKAPFLGSTMYRVGYAYLKTGEAACGGRLWVEPGTGALEFTGDNGAWNWPNVDVLLNGTPTPHQKTLSH